MTLEKRMIDYTTTSVSWSAPVVEQKEIYVETKTEVKEIIWHKDLLESMITQKQNDIENLSMEVAWLQSKLDEINVLSKMK
jgi:hypothetical protein